MSDRVEKVQRRVYRGRGTLKGTRKFYFIDGRGMMDNQRKEKRGIKGSGRLYNLKVNFFKEDGMYRWSSPRSVT